NNLNVANNIINIPNSYKEALQSPEKEHWIASMCDEIKALKLNKTYNIVKLPPGCTPIGNRWIFSVKIDPNGSYRYKSRLVAQGFSQTPGINYTDTFAPTARMTTIRIIINIAVQEGFPVHQMDVNNAYLNSNLDFDVYMRQPEGFVEQGINYTCKLNKGLYGLKQSGFLWNDMIVNFFKSLNLTQSQNDMCLFVRIQNDEKLFVILYVDDLIVVASSMTILTEFKSKFSKKFKVKDMGQIRWFLGMQFVVSNSHISINQSLYTQNILQRFNMSDCNPRNIPCDLSVYSLLTTESEPCEDPTAFRELIGSLIYLHMGTRPDLTFIISLLSQFMSSPKKIHMKLALGVLRYLKTHLHYELKYVKCQDGLNVIGYSDSDFAQDSDRKSRSGYCFKLNKSSALISWRSAKQSLVADSTCESEYLALNETLKEALFLRQLFADVTKQPMERVTIYADNLGSISLAQHPSFHRRTKHIDIKFHSIRDYIAKDYISVVYIPSNSNLSDMFTKPLPAVKLNNFSIVRGKV
ncbi:unnamed protein product, partial [Meganyctiphanes norvegica]